MGVKRPMRPRLSVFLIESGQGFASPVLPFAGKVERFPDKPGARPQTCQLFAQGSSQQSNGATCCPGDGWGRPQFKQPHLTRKGCTKLA